MRLSDACVSFENLVSSQSMRKDAFADTSSAGDLVGDSPLAQVVDI